MPGQPKLLIPRTRYGCAVLAGIVLGSSFPNPGIAGLAWIAPALMVLVAAPSRGWETYRIGYVAALSHYLFSLGWLLLIPFRWHGIPLGPALGWLALSAFLALFPAVWVFLIVPSPPATEHSNIERSAGTASYPSAWLSMEWGQRLFWALRGAVLWVGMEMLIARVLSGFPWNLLGASQFRLLPLLQICSFTGIYGVSFLVVFSSLSLFNAVAMIIRRPLPRYGWMAEIAPAIAIVAACFVYGLHVLRQPLPEGRTISVILVQPSIPQTLIWDETRDDQRFAEVLRVSQISLFSNRTDVLIWPEAAVPNLLRYNADTLRGVTNLAASNHVWMIVGADDAEAKEHPRDKFDAYYYNSSFLISPDGRIVDNYRKRSLVMFGEYVPLEHTLPFLKYLTPIQGGYQPGRMAGRFQMADLDIITSVLICFEDVFPHLVREYVHEHTDFLVNITNDGWFGEGSAQWQHATSALFRAIENGVPLVRCCNTGLTCWIDARGRLRQVFHDSKGTIYGPGFLNVQVPANGREGHPLTFYTQHGDIFGWLCAFLSIGVIVFRMAQARVRARSVLLKGS